MTNQIIKSVFFFAFFILFSLLLLLKVYEKINKTPQKFLLSTLKKEECWEDAARGTSCLRFTSHQGPKSEHGLSLVVGLKSISANGHLYFFAPSAAIGWNWFQADNLA